MIGAIPSIRSDDLMRVTKTY